MAGSARNQRPIDVAIVMFDEGLSSTAMMPTEIFHSAGVLWNALHGEPAEPSFRVRTVSLDGNPVRGPAGYEVVPHGGLDLIERTDIVVVPTSGLELEETLVRNSVLLPWLRHHHGNGAYVVGVCMGAAYLAEAGLLHGRLATSHWAACDALTLRYPGVRWRPELFVTEDSRILCSGGVSGAIDVSLYLVEKLCGHELALQCAKVLLLPMPRMYQSGYAALPVSTPHDNERIRAAEAFLHANMRGEIQTRTLARAAGMTERTFVRHFKSATGKLPAAYLQAIRIDAAKTLLERSEKPVQLISSEVGYQDITFFRTIFKRATGMTPAEYRKTFAPMNVRGFAAPVPPDRVAVAVEPSPI